MLPSTHVTDNNNNNSNEAPLPTTSPSDRHAASIRLMLGDAQASAQQLSDRVDKVLDLQRQEAKKLEQLIGGAVQSVERVVTAVAESNAAHTLKLEETLTRCARLEEALSVQSNAITELGAKCDLVLSQTSSALIQLDKAHATLDTLHALPGSVENNQLKTERALDRSSQLLSAETRNWMSEYAKEMNVNLDRVRDEFKRASEAWDGALSLHRQETSVMFSAVLAGIRSVPGSTTGVGHTRIPVDNNTTADRSPETSHSGIAPNPTHTVASTTHGPSSSSGFVTASEEPQAQHAAKNPTSSARHTQPSLVHGKNSTRSEGRVLVEDTQSTALSSVPEEDQPGESVTFERGRGFSALGKRAGSAFASFTNPGSPGFTVQRRPFVPESTLQPSPSLPKNQPHPDSSAQAATPAPTLDRSSPSLRPTLQKRPARVEDAPPGPTKRSRKTKTRVLMDSQELLRLDSSPER
ncbi:unnamed protein product [Rhizoctonia solani]|uniref:Uncharacterized protein n=1 Tax=Rhizoctonia solani TaxID=456999 RepID=A0A8H3GUA5_9AGAM|nr:unnamed protein product [Rhizoctonia solani]